MFPIEFNLPPAGEAVPPREPWSLASNASYSCWLWLAGRGGKEGMLPVGSGVPGREEG
jgi:hypothetical protein